MPTHLILSKVYFLSSFISWRHEYLKTTIFIKNVCFEMSHKFEVKLMNFGELVIVFKFSCQYWNRTKKTYFSYFMKLFFFLFVKCCLFILPPVDATRESVKESKWNLTGDPNKIQILLFCPILLYYNLLQKSCHMIRTGEFTFLCLQFIFLCLLHQFLSAD